MKGYIYKISSPLIKEFYIGSTVRPVKRKAEHMKNFKLGRHSAKPLQTLYSEYKNSISENFNPIIFEIIKEVEIENRDELFTIEQNVIDECIRSNEPLCNSNLNVAKHISSKRAFKSYEEFREAKIIFEIDTFYFHIAEYLKIHKDTLNKALSLKETYLEYNELYKKENLSWEEKVEIYLNEAKKYQKHINSNFRGVSTYKYISIFIMYELMFRVDEIAPMLGFETTGFSKIITADRPITHNAKKILETWTLDKKLSFISEIVDKQMTRASGKPVPFSLYLFIVEKRKQGMAIKDLCEITYLDRTVISKYCNGKGSQKHIDLYNNLTEQEKQKAVEILEKNPLLLPLNAL